MARHGNEDTPFHGDTRAAQAGRSMSNKREQKMKRNASKAPVWLRTGAAAIFDPHGEKAYRTKKLGTFGAASEVRHIDPSEHLPKPPKTDGERA
jgi:hypothetical protein